MKVIDEFNALMIAATNKKGVRRWAGSRMPSRAFCQGFFYFFRLLVFLLNVCLWIGA